MPRRTALLLLALFLGLMSHAPAQTSARATPALVGMGVSIAMTETEIFVGRPGEFPMFPMPPGRPGGVHIFGREAPMWREVGMLTDERVQLGDGFGSALAAHGNTIAVGAPKSVEGAGRVYVFTRDDSGTWNNATVLEARTAGAEGMFGEAIAIQDDRLVIGAPGTNDARGRIFVYRRNGANWSLTSTLAPSDLTAGDRFGAAVTMENDQIVVGAPGTLPTALFGGSGPRQGAAYVFRRGARGDWTQSAKLSTEAPDMLTFGHAVAITGSTILVAAPFASNGSGTVIEFDNAAGSWGERSTIQPATPTPGGMFGYSLAISGPRLLVGSPGEPSTQGAIRLFGRSSAGGPWSETQRLSARMSAMIGFFGGAVAASPTTLAVGAPGADFFDGLAFVFEQSPNGGWNDPATLVETAPELDILTGTERTCTDGAIEGFDCGEVDLLAFLPNKALGADRGVLLNDVWGWKDSVTGREYALVGRTNGTAFVDMTNASNPTYLGELPLSSTGTVNVWRDIKVYRNHAFIVADNAGAHGMQIFDLTQLRNVAGGPTTFMETARYDGIASAHNIVINEASGYAYAVGSSGGGETCGGGLHMINIQDPTNPQFVGCFADPTTGNAGTGYSHDAQCIIYQGPDTEHHNKEICFGSNETALSIADVTDKNATVALGSASYPNVAYAHQGWVSDDHRYFFQNDEGDELVGSVPRTRTLVWDIEDLDDPVLAIEFLGTTAASDHNLYVRGRYMYQSNYVAGLRIIDIADPTKPVEVGYFDTVPVSDNVPGFAGSWSNYPYFDSGAILVTSMREGLFIVKKRNVTIIP